MTLVGYDEGGMIFQNSWGTWCGTPGPGLSYITWEDSMEYITEINWYDDISGSCGASPVAVDTTTTTAGPSTCFTVELDALRYANEISWTLGSGGTTHCSSTGSYSSNTVTTETCCFPMDSLPATIDLECADAYGDGWHGGHLTLFGYDYCDTFDSGASMQLTVTTDGTEPAHLQTTCAVSTNGQCGTFNGVHTSCPAGESCSAAGWCGTSRLFTRTAQADYSDANCPTSVSSTILMALGNTELAVNFFALVGLVAMFYFIATSISNRFKYERIDDICEQEC